MPLRIRRRPQAAEDVLDIWEYIAAESLQSADRIVDAFDARFHFLASHPDAGVERPELGDRVRSFPEGRFLIFYRHDTQVLDIIRVLSVARNLNPAMFE